jgi:hypothetical protein
MLRTILLLALGLAGCDKKSSSDGCTKDTDCKGDRVCNAGACVEQHQREEPPQDMKEPNPNTSARAREMFKANKTDIATLTAKKYAYEAYPSWATTNPSKQCPDKLDELNDFMNSKDIKDPWGNPYKMLCGQNAPAGMRGMGIVSNGEDGKEGTPDDIKSWE